jgi:hypothetical protein
MFTLNISKKLFWDIDLSNFDNIRNKRLIIERVFSMGDLTDIKILIQFYGVETIKQEIINAGYLDNKTLSWVSDFFNISKTKFKCFSKKQSNQVHWNY